MSCSRYRQLISRYIDDEVTPRQRADLLAHVQVCRDCAAWLARTRQTDVLLKGISDTRPSDRVRNAILNEVRRTDDSSRPKGHPAHRTTNDERRARWHFLRPSWAALLLRFDPSPKRIALGMAASLIVLVGLAFYFNLLPPFWAYDKLGFEYQPDSGQAMVDTTPISVKAVSAGKGGVGGPMAVPNLVRILPADKTQGVALDTPLRVRFDQPMDHASVESALRIDPPAAGTFTWDADNEVRFTPAAPGLLRGITYTVTLTATALSMAGTPIKDEAGWSFHTVPIHKVYSVTPEGASTAPTSTFLLQFDAPMQRADAGTIASLRQVSSNVAVPFTYAWDVTGQSLAIQPARALAEGSYYLDVKADARTQADESLGRPYEFKYRVVAPAIQLRLLGGRVLLSDQSRPISVLYQFGDSARALTRDLDLDVYTLPAERLSALGAQVNSDGALPPGFPAALQQVKEVKSTGAEQSGSVLVDGLLPGIYLLMARASAGGQPGDWKMLVLTDFSLAVTGSNSPIWATNGVGRAWVGAEVSLYSPAGALLEKGLTNEFGLWTPSAKANGAGLAITRDLGGHVAASLVGSDLKWGQQAQSTLLASLVTDLPAYRPGGTINFRLLLHDAQNGIASTPAAEEDVSVLLLLPSGAVVEALTLRPDSVGGITGLFPLSSNTQPGVYAISVQTSGAKHDFPVTVLPNRVDGLSVYIIPNADTEVGTTITRTVSVLAANGEPASGALVTAQLGILGDSWVSDPVTATTNDDGRATFVSPLPDWFARFNDPGLYLSVQAQQNSLRGSDRTYLDLTAQRLAISGMTQLVSPGLNLAVIARPAPDGSSDLRLVLVNQERPDGDILVDIQALSGERVTYSLDMAHLLDATLNLSRDFAGGSVTLRAPDKTASRTLRLMPAHDPGAALDLTLPLSVTAGSALPLQLRLAGSDGTGLGGTASVWLRRVSGDSSSAGSCCALTELPEQDWRPSVALSANITATEELQAPNAPGLWYVMIQAATPAGNSTLSWGVVRVMPGPWAQLPPMDDLVAGSIRTFWVTAHNPTADYLSTGLRASPQGAVHIENGDSQGVDVEAGSWERLEWQAIADEAGSPRIAFSFMPGSGSEGVWALNLHSRPNPQVDTTYTSGTLTGERSVGVAVPWSLSGDSIQLEIRASSSLLPALAGVAADLQSSPSADAEGVSASAARLSASASVASAFVRLNSTVPDNLALSGAERSLLLQQLYSAQHEDGGWSYTLDGRGLSSIDQTAQVLMSLHRQMAYTTGSGVMVAPDPDVLNRALDFLSNELARPLDPDANSAELDERAYGLYVLSLYSRVPSEQVRPLLAFAASGLDSHGLSRDGQAWLALALWQIGNGADAVALLDRLLLTRGDSSPAPSAPTLEALVVGLQSLPNGGVRSRELPDYATSARQYARALMESREGAGWHTPAMTADAIWALSRYAIADGETPQLGRAAPTLTLGDRTVQAESLPGNLGTVSVVLSGAELHPGTNWLKLKAPNPNAIMYYSLTLIARR